LVGVSWQLVLAGGVGAAVVAYSVAGNKRPATARGVACVAMRLPRPMKRAKKEKKEKKSKKEKKAKKEKSNKKAKQQGKGKKRLPPPPSPHPPPAAAAGSSSVSTGQPPSEYGTAKGFLGKGPALHFSSSDEESDGDTAAGALRWCELVAQPC